MAEFQTADQETLKKYLFGELGETETAAMEDAFFADDDLFADLHTLENDLIDRCARGEMTGGELARFTKSLEKIPARREKIANARALQKFIAAENQPKVVAPETVSLADKIRAFFAFNSSAGRIAAVACIVLLALAAIFLLFDRYRLNQQLAGLQNQKGAVEREREQQKTDLQNQLNAVREREQNLQNQLEAQKGELDDRQQQTDELNRQIESERAARQKLEKQLEDLQRAPSEKTPNQKPILAAIFLSPGGGKGGGVKTLRLGGASNTRIILAIPAAQAKENFVVSVNGATVNANIKSRNGKTIIINVPAARFNFEADNTITLKAADGAELNYFLSVEK